MSRAIRMWPSPPGVGYQAFKVTRHDNGATVDVTPDLGFTAEKLGIGPGCLIKVGAAPSFVCRETLEDINTMMGGTGA